MKLYLGITDPDWFKFLKRINPEEINFWQPSGISHFRVLKSGEPFLFKIKKSRYVGGLGFFVQESIFPISLSWNIFGINNGVDNYENFIKKIQNLRSQKNSLLKNPNIGCVILTNPIFFEQSDWILVPENFETNIVKGKSYDTIEKHGNAIWKKIKFLLDNKYLQENPENSKENQLIAESNAKSEYGKSILIRVRLGQQAFRFLVTEAYKRRCSISGERTLPALDSAHIKPFSKSGTHKISNGILLRSDLHKLFDTGYLTITKEYRVEVSHRIKEEFENGSDYYKYNGNNLTILPERIADKPSRENIEWHNNFIYKS